jgi:hypothetical protein
MTFCAVIPSDGIVFPPKEKANLPKTNALPLWPEGTGKFKWFFISPFKRRNYIYEYDYITYISSLKKFCFIQKNFVYDAASIPQVIPGCAHDGPLFYGSGPHDYGYRFRGMYLSEGPEHPFIWTYLTHFQCDEMFTSLNDKENGLPCSNRVIELVLNGAGYFSYGQRDIRDVDWSKPVYSKP